MSKKDLSQDVLDQLRKARSQNDSFGIGTYGPEDELTEILENLLSRDLVTVERYPDGSSWWRAIIQ